MERPRCTLLTLPLIAVVPRGTAQLRLLLLAAACLALAAPASAQIYSWRDDAGNLVLSNRARSDGPSRAIPSYPVPHAENVRATRFAAGQGCNLAHRQALPTSIEKRRAHTTPTVTRPAVDLRTSYRR